MMVKSKVPGWRRRAVWQSKGAAPASGALEVLVKNAGAKGVSWTQRIRIIGVGSF